MATQEVTNQGTTSQEQQNETYKTRLLQKIHEKRAIVKAFVKKRQRRSILLMNLNIGCAGIAALLTAGPAFGGEKFTGNVQTALNLSTDSTVWRTLCLAALILSLIAFIANNLYRSQDMAGQLAKAQATSVLLDGLETMVEFGLYSLDDATKMFQQYVSDVAFIEEI